MLTAEKEASEYFEAVAKGRDGKQAANWVITNLFAVLEQAGPQHRRLADLGGGLGKLLDLMADGTISGRIAKEVFEIMAETGGDPAAIIEAKGLRQITDAGAIEAAVAKVIADNPSRSSSSGRQREGAGLAGRPGDEGDPGQGEPRPGQPAAATEAGSGENGVHGLRRRCAPGVPTYEKRLTSTRSLHQAFTT